MKRLWLLIKEDENRVEDTIHGGEKVKELRGRVLEGSSTHTLKLPRIKTGEILKNKPGTKIVDK